MSVRIGLEDAVQILSMVLDKKKVYGDKGPFEGFYSWQIARALGALEKALERYANESSRVRRFQRAQNQNQGEVSLARTLNL
jgi:hypothetical protein